jgi:hypothetical protein
MPNSQTVKKITLQLRQIPLTRRLLAYSAPSYTSIDSVNLTWTRTPANFAQTKLLLWQL